MHRIRDSPMCPELQINSLQVMAFEHKGRRRDGRLQTALFLLSANGSFNNGGERLIIRQRNRCIRGHRGHNRSPQRKIL